MIRNVGIVLLSIGLAACGAENPDQEALELSSIDSALEPGTWVNPPGNGVQTGDSGGAGPLTVCRASYDNGEQPGKVWEGTCNFGWGGVSHRKSSYKVLKQNGYTWKNPSIQDCSSGLCLYKAPLPNNAVDGGDAGDAAHHVRLGICQALVDGTWHPGKYFKEKCNIALGGTPQNPGSGIEKVITPGPQGHVEVLVK